MVKIVSDNGDVKQALDRLAGQVEALGGTLSNHLTIECKGGNMRLVSDLPPSSSEQLVVIPAEAFVPLSDVPMALEKDHLVLPSGYGSLSPERRKLLDTMLEIYNLTDKIAKYRQHSPRIAFRKDAETIKRLIAGRAGTKVAKGFFEAMETTDLDGLVIDLFFRTRNFSQGGEKRQIIPFIDFTNHHPLAPPFKDIRVPKPAKILLNSKPLMGSDECFARYGRWDGLDTYLMFGFAAHPQAFVRSIPCRIDLPGGGALVVKAEIANRRTNLKLGQGLEALRPLLPRVRPMEGGVMEVSSLKIPNARSPLALKRTLGMLLKHLRPNAPAQALETLILQAEETLISANEAFYKALASYLEGVSEKYRDNVAFEAANEMVRIQLSTLADYRGFSAAP